MDAYQIPNDRFVAVKRTASGDACMAMRCIPHLRYKLDSGEGQLDHVGDREVHVIVGFVPFPKRNTSAQSVFSRIDFEAEHELASESWMKAWRAEHFPDEQKGPEDAVRQ